MNVAAQASEGSVKGSLLLARLRWVETELGAAVADEVRRTLEPLLSPRSGHLVSCVRYPATVAAAILVALRPHASAGSLWQRLGEFEARELLRGAYASLLRPSPTETARRLPTLYATLYSDVRVAIEMGSGSSCQFTLNVPLSPDDLAVQVGLVAEAMRLSGAKEVRVSAERPDAASSVLSARWSATPDDGTLLCEPVAIENEAAIMECRRRIRQVSATVGLPEGEYVAMVTCVSELARNIVNYAGKGRLEIQMGIRGGRRCLRIRAIDDGPGIPHLEEVLSGRYRSRSGLGRGLIGVKKLVDEMDIQTAPGRGTTIEIVKYLRGE